MIRLISFPPRYFKTEYGSNRVLPESALTYTIRLEDLEHTA